MDHAIAYLLAFIFGAALGGVLGGWLLHFRSLARIKELETQHQADADKIDWSNQAQQHLRETFEALASQSLRANADHFAGRVNEQLSSHANQIGMIKASLEGNLSHLDQYVRLLEQKREGAYSLLAKQVDNLQEAYGELRHTNDQLLNVLRAGPVRGRWGEIQLRKVIELAGMTPHVSFDEQVSGEDGKPDVVVYLPNQGQITIDAKFPLTAFLEAMTATDPSVRGRKLQEHVRAIRNQIKELSEREYWGQFQPSPELVVLFVPMESCLLAAYEADPEIVEYALARKVILASPVTLMGFLKALAYGWQQFTISQNAHRILEQGWELYKRVNHWLDHYQVMGQKLGAAVEAYNKSVGSLQARVLPSARRFQELTAIADELTEVATLDCGLQLSPKKENVDRSPNDLVTAPPIS